MTVRTRLALLSPVWALAVRKSHEAARLAATVRRLEHDLVVTRAELAVANIDREALRSHLAEAVKGRERAMSIAKELGGAPRWNEADDVWMRSHGVQP